MSFYRSGNPIEDAAAYYAGCEKEVETMHRCAYDDCFYDESDMIFESIHSDWIAKVNVDEWLKLCFEFDEQSIYEQKLKQLKP